ncbi:hypothetical protein ACFXA3_31000, partial [Streptomyces sp. NPDC059456]
MSTPEEQQHQQAARAAQAAQQDPYGTQTWQSDTWDTGYQPVQPQPQSQPQPGAVPGQQVAPEGWFRDEPRAPQAPAESRDWSGGAASGAAWPQGPAAAAEQSVQSAYPPPHQGQGQAAAAPQPVAPEGWFRDEAPAAAWSAGSGSAAEQTA